MFVLDVLLFSFIHSFHNFFFFFNWPHWVFVAAHRLSLVAVNRATLLLESMDSRASV